MWRLATSGRLKQGPAAKGACASDLLHCIQVIGASSLQTYMMAEGG